MTDFTELEMSIRERIRLQGSSGVIFQWCSNIQITVFCPVFTWPKVYYFEDITNLFEFDTQTKIFFRLFVLFFLSRIAISHTGKEKRGSMANSRFTEIN